MPVDFGLSISSSHGDACARESDLKIASIVSSSRAIGCNFICYPIGGMLRDCWEPTPYGQNLPELHLPDLQMPNSLWQDSVVGTVSSWIDQDARDEWLAAVSTSALEEVII